MQTLNDIEDHFNNDVERIASELIDGYGLKYEQEVSDLSNPLLRWLDFVARYIPPQPREIVPSNKFPKNLDPNTERAFHKLERLILDGGDINPYQSKGLVLRNDTSGNKRQSRTDLLWADWGIHHLHIVDEPIGNNSYFSERSDWLLFCIVGSDFIGLIDIREHGEKDLFSDQELLKTVAESWPEIMERYRINGISATSTSYSSKDIGELRKSGITSLITIDSHVYMGPGMGVTTATTPTRVSMAEIKVGKYVRELAKLVFDEGNQFKKEAIASEITNSEFSLELTERGLAVYEKKGDKAFVLPRTKHVGSQNFLAELHDFIVPAWAMSFIIGKKP